MSEQTPIEAARAWSEARGLSVEWEEMTAYDTTCCANIGGVTIVVDSKHDGTYRVTVSAGVAAKAATPTAALDASAEQAAKLCGALAKLNPQPTNDPIRAVMEARNGTLRDGGDYTVEWETPAGRLRVSIEVVAPGGEG